MRLNNFNNLSTMVSMTTKESVATMRPIELGSKADADMTCTECGKVGKEDTFFTYQGENDTDVHLCSTCREKINVGLEQEERDLPLGRGVMGGVVAAVVGAIIWYFFTTITGMQFGYVAIGLGWLIGTAVVWGAGKRRGQKLQLTSALCTLASILVAEYFIFSHFLYEYMVEFPEEFEWWNGAQVWVSPFDPMFYESLISPMGLLIYAIALYVAFSVPKTQRV